jgi:hypothetical protein
MKTKCVTVVCLCAAASVLLATDGARGQCRNGMCPTNPLIPDLSLPVEANVYGQQDMGPIEKQIVQQEKAALEKWYAGDPTPYLAMVGADVGYFEPYLEKRLDGKGPLTDIYEALRGKVHAQKFDMLNTRVQATDHMAVLSFNLIAIEGGIPFRWNCTEVFSLGKDGQWKLIHSHWSQTKPPQQGR